MREIPDTRWAVPYSARLTRRFGAAMRRKMVVVQPIVKPTMVRYSVHDQHSVQDIPMDAITYTAARTNLAKTMEQVCDDHSPVIITRSKSQSVVMISLDDYEALQETAYLLRAPKNARRLLESVAELEQSGGQEKELLE